MTTQKDIKRWFDEGIRRGAKWMLVLCDTFDYEDYPVYTTTATDTLSRYNNPGKMQRVMEVYDLSLDAEPQLCERRSLNLPRG